MALDKGVTIMKKAIQQLVVMADGEVRIPTGGEVAHGHRPPDERIKIVVPASKRWVLVEVEVEVEEARSAGIAALLQA
jgi:hypothetical protein